MFRFKCLNLRRQWLECVGHVLIELFVLLLQQMFYGTKLLKGDWRFNKPGFFVVIVEL